MDNYFVITGAPGSGKSSIISILNELGYLTIHEPAREVIAEQRSINGSGTYDQDPRLFKELMLSRAIYNYKSHRKHIGPVFFDRGIPDILAYSDCFDLPRGSEQVAAKRLRYNPKVFFAPCWRKIYQKDEERQMSFEQTKIFGDNLKQIYSELHYEMLELPFKTVAERVDFIIQNLEN